MQEKLKAALEYLDSRKINRNRSRGGFFHHYDRSDSTNIRKTIEQAKIRIESLK